MQNQPNPMLPFTSLIGTQCHPITDQLGETKRQEANVEAEIDTQDVMEYLPCAICITTSHIDK